MSVGKKLAAAALAAVLGALIAPAFAQNGSSDTQGRSSDRGLSMGHMGGGMMGQGMMGGGMMGGGMMGGGMMGGGMMGQGMMAQCAEMMRFMNNGGDGRPNSQWRQ
ncbi:MAG: hypothetical protein IRZ23_11735, partial [Acetobacteraceae bacterium]|nr:hypothetical protein [Acetobacteraceae bacterium]